MFEGPFERGNAYLDTGEYKKAVADFDRAIAIDPSHATAWLNRGEAYRRLGDSKRAEEDTAKARQLEPGIVAAASPSPPPKELVADGRVKSQPPRFGRAPGAGVASGQGFPASPKDFTSNRPPHPPRSTSCAAKDRSIFASRFKCRPKDKRRCGSHASKSRRPPAPINRRRCWSSENLHAPASSDQPYTGGKVVEFVENWKPVQQKLVPVVFEYPLH